MIPEFNEDGLLPPGIHRATLEEFKERFVIFNRSDRRLRVFEGLNQLIQEAARSNIVQQILIGGSFVTAKAGRTTSIASSSSSPAWKEQR